MKAELLKILKEEGCLAYKLHTGKTDPSKELWALGKKLYGIAYLLEAADCDIVADEVDLRGMGLILRDLASETHQVANYLEKSEVTNE